MTCSNPRTIASVAALAAAGAMAAGVIVCTALADIIDPKEEAHNAT